MRFQTLIIAALTGCISTLDCTPDEEQFAVDEVITAEDVTVMVENWGLSDSSQLECEDVCGDVYEQTTGWYTSTVSTCTMSLTDDGGDIQCEGEGFESCGE